MSQLNLFVGDYRLQQKVGKGSFGEVFQCTKGNQKFAAKLEPRRKKGRRRRGPSQLEYENRVYGILKGGAGIPAIEAFFVQDDYNVMIMKLLGKSIQSVFESSGRNIPLVSVIAIGLRILSHLSYVHSKGFIHRDIKPQNIMLSAKATDPQIYLIDFGLSKRFWADGKHIPYKDRKHGLTGTPRYCSINAMLGVEQSRRDDLESLGYVIIYLATQGKLPWMGMSREKGDSKHQKILQTKQNVSNQELCAGLPKGIYDYMTTVKRLKFDERPPYDTLYDMLLSAYEAEL